MASKTPNIKVIYFDLRGRAEILRLILKAAGVEFEDIRHTRETWQEEKPHTPFGQAPCLEINGKRYAQSMALANYLAKEYGFHGKTNLEALSIDQVVMLANDFFTTAAKSFFESDATKKAELMKNLKEVETPKYLRFFENLLKENGTGYFVGSSLTLADIAVYDIIYSFSKKGLVKTDDFPKVQALFELVGSQEGIKEWVQTRPQTDN